MLRHELHGSCRTSAPESGRGTNGAKLVNTMLADNSPGGNGAGAITDLGHNLSSDVTCAFTNTGSMNNTFPRLGALTTTAGQRSLWPCFPVAGPLMPETPQPPRRLTSVELHVRSASRQTSAPTSSMEQQIPFPDGGDGMHRGEFARGDVRRWPCHVRVRWRNPDFQHGSGHGGHLSRWGRATKSPSKAAS